MKIYSKIRNKNYLYHIFFFIILLVFSLLKWSDLYLPYFWDELGVYSRAALYMFDNKVSLMPADLPVELSRGHPLLFAFIYGTWFKIVGIELFYAHLLSLVFSLSLLGITYLFGQKYFSAQVGLLGTLILSIQPLFIAQSTLLLPEVMLAIFSVLSIYFYLDQKLLWAGAIGSLAVLTKETAIVIPIALSITELFRYYYSKRSFISLIKNISIIIIPYYVFILFISIQKIQNGWYFFPYHTDFVSFKIADIYWRGLDCIKFVFLKQGRYVWLIIIVLSFIYSILDNKKELIRDVRFIKNPMEKHFRGLMIILYTLGVLGFSALNFQLNRYLLLIFPIICVIIAYYILKAVKRNKWNSYIILISILVPLFYISSNHFVNDEDMSFKHQVQVQKQISEYIDRRNSEIGGKIIMTDFPIDFGLIDSRAGYVKNTNYRLGKITNNDFNSEADFYIYSLPGNLPEQMVYEDKLELIEKFESSYAKVYLYKTKK